MLNSLNLSDKTYEELLAEAVAQIPLYSSEWTNFNVSDPGITLLQNLTAFQLLQQESINDVTDEIRQKLLKLVGYTPRENRAATVLVQAPAQGGPILPEGHRLWSGTIPFETTGPVALSPWGLAAVYAEDVSGFAGQADRRSLARCRSHDGRHGVGRVCFRQPHEEPLAVAGGRRIAVFPQADVCAGSVVVAFQVESFAAVRRGYLVEEVVEERDEEGLSVSCAAGVSEGVIG